MKTISIYSCLYEIISALARAQAPWDKTMKTISIYTFLYESFRDQSAYFTRDIIVGRPCVVSHKKVYLVTKRYAAVHLEVTHGIILGCVLH